MLNKIFAILSRLAVLLLYSLFSPAVLPARDFSPGTEWTGISGSASNDLIVVGEYGAISRFNGTRWSPVENQTATWLSAVFQFSSHAIFAAGYNGVILHFNGTRWEKMETGITNDLNGIWGSSPENIYAVGDRGT
ncbi:MAG: hypothetical protein HYR80_06770, partial [Nitrospirae bacterium]|nr:hypothetical protein [Nitrospirota bacterium]